MSETNKNRFYFLLHGANCYYFLVVLQALRLIPITIEYIQLAFILLISTALLEFILQKYLVKTLFMKISLIILFFSQLVLILFNLDFLFFFIIVSYILFFPGYFNLTITSNPNPGIYDSFLLTLSFGLSFILNFIERLFFLHFNIILVTISLVFFALVVVLSKFSDIKVQPENRVEISLEKLNIFVKNQLSSTLLSLILSCLFSFLIIMYNYPSLVGLATNLDYNFSVFILITLVPSVILIILLSLNYLNSGNKKQLLYLLLISNVVFIITAISTSLFITVLNLVLIVVSFIMIFFLITLIIDSYRQYTLKLPFMFSIALTIGMYALATYLGQPFLMILINCAILLICSIIFLIIFMKSKLQWNLNINRPELYRKVMVSILIIGILISLVPLFKSAATKDTNKTYDKRVLAFYYTWYGTPIDYTDQNSGIIDPLKNEWFHWNSGSETPTPQSYAGTNTPEKGLYDSNDPSIIQYHLNLAEEAGIDSFICTWWGINDATDVTFANLMIMVEKTNSPLKLSIYYETYGALGRPISETIEKISNDILYIINKYGSSDIFLKVEGKPVIFIYSSMLFSVLTWEKILRNVKEQHDCFLIADIVPNPEPRTELFSAFDGIHIYNPTTYLDAQAMFSLNYSVDEIYNSMSITAKSQGKLCALTVIPGYDDRVIRDPGILIERNNGMTYDYLWRSSLIADWVLITSFNEWHEGTDIEPSAEYGDYYIKQTGMWSDCFKSE